MSELRVKNSSFRGFLGPGSGAPFTWGEPALGWGTGYYDSIPPLVGQPFDDFLEQVVAAITGLDPTLVRPRFQNEPPNLPDFGTDWAAVGVLRYDPVGYPAARHDPNGNGSDWQQDTEYLDFLCSFYGPNCDLNSRQLRSGLFVAQNREALYLNGVGLVDVGNRLRVPAYLKERWTDKYDVNVRLVRVVLQAYPVLNLLSIVGQVNVPFAVGFETPVPAGIPDGVQIGVNSALTVRGDVSVTGNISAGGSVMAGAGTSDQVQLQTHLHGDVMSGGSSTNTPTPGT